MKNQIFKQLFNFEIFDNQRISITRNEVYNQLLLYVFFSVKRDLIIVTPTLNEANKLYNDLKNYVDNIFIFPEDDYLTKNAIASSPELLMLRMKFLNSINVKSNKIVIAHLNSFLKKLPSVNEYSDKHIRLHVGKIISRDRIVKKLDLIGYKRESLVSNNGEFSVRGFVLDIFPIDSLKPIRLEFFGDEIERIRYFDENTQRTVNEIDNVIIKPYIDEFKNASSNVLEYLNNPFLIYQDINQINNVEKALIEQIKFYNSSLDDVFNLSDIRCDNKIFIDLIDNNKNYDLVIRAEEIEIFNNNVERFVDSIEKNRGILYSVNNVFVNKIKSINSKIVVEFDNLNRGFIFNNKYYYSENDLLPIKQKGIFENNYKLGKKINDINLIKVGDYVVHKTHGIGVYMGISTILKNGVKKDYILIKYKGTDKLYLSVDDVSKLYKYSSKEGSKPKIYNLNSSEWQKTKLKIKGKIKDITDELLKIYKERASSTVEAFMEDDPSQKIFENEFQFEETIDQLKTTEEIKRDLEGTHPMDRLLCGDVGYGKTEVIFRAIYKTVINNKQVMYLCPTTLLSHQQFTSAIERFKNYSVNIALLNRHTTKSEVMKILDKLKTGKIDVIFGTHRLLSSDIEFKDLGLLVVDEEQRFGVMHKEKIKRIKSNVHVLTVSATPIPRSLQMSLIGIRDLSLIETAPKNRYPVQTYVIGYSKEILREVIMKELSREGQVFILYNRIEDMSALVDSFKKLVPEAKIGFAHGKMNKYEIQQIMSDFTDKIFDVLVSTTIIENGIDIPNANTMIVMDADRFGLSQLYQIRGRVGRGDRIAYAYLMYEKSKILTETARKRLEAIKEFTELGSGYKISMRDLSIRGAGDLLGSEQAGFIDSVGVDLYMELINEEINEVEETDNNQIVLDDVETHIGENYSDEDEIIIMLHKKINSIKSKEDFEEIYNEIVDRFGSVDETLEIYMKQEWFEKIISRYNIKITENNNRKITLKIEPEVYSKLSVESLFIEASRINSKFNFVYRGNCIYITLLKVNLEEHYLSYLLKLVTYIDETIKK